MIKSVTLINPPGQGFSGHRSTVVMPLGLGILARYLKQHNIQTRICDIHALLRLETSDYKKRCLLRKLNRYLTSQTRKGVYEGLALDNARDLAQKLLADCAVERSDLVGIRINSFSQIISTLLIAEYIKSVFNKKVVVGGPFVTLYAHHFFQKYNFIDYAVVGDGEEPLLRLIQCLNGQIEIEAMPSLYYRREGAVVSNKRKFYDIEKQALPDYSGLDLHLYSKQDLQRWIPYILSRGCVNKCSFCVYYKVDVTWQKKSPEKVVSDLKFLVEQCGSQRFAFDDINFNIDYGYVEKVCDAIIASGLQIKWGVRIMPKNIDERLLKKMWQAGCRYLSWGIESGSQRIIDSMQKGQRIDDQARILRAAKEAGIYNNIYLMIRYPGETIDDIRKTEDFIRTNKDVIDRVFIYNFTIYKDTVVCDQAEKFGLKKTRKVWSDLFEIYRFEALGKHKRSPHDEQQLEQARDSLKKTSLRLVNYRNFGIAYRLFDTFMSMKAHDWLLKMFLRLYYSKHFDRLPFLHNKNIVNSLFENYAFSARKIDKKRIGQ